MDLPSSPESELGVIGCCLEGGLETTLQAVEQLPASAMMMPDCQEAFNVLEKMATHGKRIDVAEFILSWKQHKRSQSAQPPPAILDSVGGIPSPANLHYYIQILVEAHQRRRIILAANAIASKACRPDLSIDAICAEFESFLMKQEQSGVDVQNGKQLASGLIADLERRMELNGKLSGIGTGFTDLDFKTNGLQAGEQTIIGARPSQGKTSLAMNIVAHASLDNDIPCLVISLEMSVAALSRRLASCCCRIPMNNLRSGQLSEDQFASLQRFNSSLLKSKVYMVEGISGMDAMRIAAIIRRYHRKYGIQLVVIDYLQKIKAVSRHEKRTYEVGEVSGILKSVAVETKVAMLTVAQLNRECDRDKGRRPKLSDLSDSSQIERDGDTIALLYLGTKNATHIDAELIIAKQRDGETGTIPLLFDGQHCRFINSSFQPKPNTKNEPTPTELQL